MAGTRIAPTSHHTAHCVCFFCSLWTNSGGGDRDAHVGQLGLPSNKGEDGRKEKEEEEEEGKKEWMRWEAETGQYSDFVSTNAKESTVPLNANMSNRLTTAPSTSPEPIVCSIFEKLKQEHDLAKAAKLDNAEVPVELWDQAICKGPPSSDKKAALTTLMGYLLGRYQ